MTKPKKTTRQPAKFFKQQATRLFLDYSPNIIFAFLYNLFLSRYRHTKIVKSHNKWLIIGQEKDDFCLLSPTPKFFNVHYKDYDSKFNRFFQVQEGETILDVGACIGDTAVPMGIKAGGIGRIIAVEPDPTNVEYLKLNLANFRNVEIIEKGAWKEKGTLELHTHSTLTGHSIIPHKERKGHRQIQVDTLDTMLGNTKVDFAKIDVQGAEIEVLRGASQLLRTCPKLIVETHDRTDELKRTYPKVLEMLKQYSYKTEFTMDNGCVYAWR